MKHHQIECPYCGRQHGSDFSMYLYKPRDMQCRRCSRVFEVERCENNEYIMRKKTTDTSSDQPLDNDSSPF